MASRDISPLEASRYADPEKTVGEKEAVEVGASPSSRPASLTSSLSGVRLDATHRTLKSRHIQLIGIGGTIGTALYVQIGKSLLNGGPASLFMAFTIWCTFILAVTMCMAEMVTFSPISSPFIRFAGRYVDEALGFAAGWNFFVFEAALVPFEVTACNLILHYWTDAIPTAAVIVVIVILYAAINLLAVRWYGEAEFWSAVGKVILIVGLIAFTVVVMAGGNPHRDAFGFRYWKRPGAFAELYYTDRGSLGRFLGFLQCLIQASFTIAGPDYVSMAAGEAENPRRVMPRAYNAVFYRLTTFFALGSLCVGILVPYDDAELAAAFRDGHPGAAASPYVVAMNRLDIPVLPHIVNAIVLLSAFSAGNSYVYCASRSLYGLALDGKAPRFLTWCTRSGVPVGCVVAALLAALLSFLQLSTGTAVVLNWLVSLVTASQLLNFACMCLTYLFWHRALRAQGISRDSLPYKAYLMPFAAWYGLAGTFIMVFVGGYTVFLPLDGFWNVPDFLFSYTMVGIYPVLYLGYKLFYKTKIQNPREIDFQRDQPALEEYERTYVPKPPSTLFERVLDIVFG